MPRKSSKPRRRLRSRHRHLPPPGLFNLSGEARAAISSSSSPETATGFFAVSDILFLFRGLDRMVCTVGRGRMAAAIRLYTTGNLPELTPDEASRERLSVQSIYEELLDSDEPNFLSDEDMHVFGNKPLIEPLQLVSCNACKKPIKASQFTKHSERCRLVDSVDEAGMGSQGGNGHKKPPRKGRKKVQSGHGDDGKFDSMAGGNKTAAFESKAGNRIQKDSLVGCEARGVIAPADRLLPMNGSGATLGNTHYYAGVMSAIEKQNDLAGTLPSLQSCCTTTNACFVNKKSDSNHRDVVICTTAIPVPLATKKYHFQRNYLRNAMGHLYHQALRKDHGFVSSSLVQSAESLGRQKDDACRKKNHDQAIKVLDESDQVLFPSSIQCPLVPSECGSSFSLANHIGVVDTSTSASNTRYSLSSRHSFPGNSGATLGPAQQSKESIPVT